MLWIKRRKRRKYPIKRDASGLSARKRAFELFDLGMRPAKIAEDVGISKDTAYRYYQDWKKQPRELDERCRDVKKLFQNNPQLMESVARYISEKYGMSVEGVIEKLQKPHGLKQLIKGEWRNPVEERKEAERKHRMEAAEHIVSLIANGIFTVENFTEAIEKHSRDLAETKAKYDKLQEWGIDTTKESA